LLGSRAKTLLHKPFLLKACFLMDMIYPFF
jgi:hypothetical protein